MNWSELEENEVRRLWLLGHTGAEIAGLTGMSRNRVLSKVRRLRLGRALRFADEVATWGSVERAALAVGVSVEQGGAMMRRMRKGLGWQAN